MLYTYTSAEHVKGQILKRIIAYLSETFQLLGPSVPYDDALDDNKQATASLSIYLNHILPTKTNHPILFAIPVAFLLTAGPPLALLFLTHSFSRHRITPHTPPSPNTPIQTAPSHRSLSTSHSLFASLTHAVHALTPHPRIPKRVRQLLLLLLRALMKSWWPQWMSSDGGSDSAKSQEQLFAKNREKLQGYYTLAKDAFTHACTADETRKYDTAVRLYGTGLEAVREGLALAVGPGSGLGPLADSVAGWRADLEAWGKQVQERLAALQSIRAGRSDPSAAPPVRPVPLSSVASRQRQLQQVRMGGNEGFAASSRQASARISSAPAAAPATTSRASAATNRPTAAATAGTAASTSNRRDDGGLQKYREAVENEILDRSPAVKWDDVAGLAAAKAALSEAVILPSLRPDLFQGLRSPVRGILLYGPPGNGKTMLAKALAAESRATFYNISASSLTSKWLGDGEKLVRALFESAAAHQPSIIFLDELDSLLSARGKAGESEAARRLLTEFLVQFDGVGGGGRERVVVVGATNRPQELDEAVRRRLTKRIYVPLPDAEGRMAVLTHLLKGVHHKLTPADLQSVVSATASYSASDLAALCKEAAMAPLRELPPQRLASLPASALRPVGGADLAAALRVVRPSVDAKALAVFDEFTKLYGTTAA